MVVSLLIPRHFLQEMGSGLWMFCMEKMHRMYRKQKKTDPVSGADAVVSADVAENVVATESADQTSGQTVAQTETLAEAADPAITEQQQAAGNEDAEDITAFREEIKDLIDELGTTWNNLYNQYNERISYGVMDPQGGYLRSNVNSPEEIFSRTVADNELPVYRTF